MMKRIENSFLLQHGDDVEQGNDSNHLTPIDRSHKRGGREWLPSYAMAICNAMHVD